MNVKIKFICIYKSKYINVKNKSWNFVGNINDT